MFLSLHTIFLLNENIKWLEEFIVYYINIGFEHFYLYDNEGSDKTEGGMGTTTTNKYGFETTSTSTDEDKILLDKLLKKYEKYITYILWQPRNHEGKIRYGQEDSIRHCITNYGNENQWIAFIDLDEFIFSKNNINLVDYLKSLDDTISNVKLIQKKFLDRFLTKERFITQELGCIEQLTIGTEWAPKSIIKCKDFLYIPNIHQITTKNNTIIPHVDILRFNHYNTNQSQLIWMTEFYKNSFQFYINGKDDGMLRYKELFLSL